MRKVVWIFVFAVALADSRDRGAAREAPAVDGPALATAAPSVPAFPVSPSPAPVFPPPVSPPPAATDAVSAGIASSATGAATVAATDDSAFLASDLDPRGDPGRDFFQYANGAWLRRHPIAADRYDAGIVSLLTERKWELERTAAEGAAGDGGAGPGSERQQVGDFYASGMDGRAIESLDLRPLQSELNRIDAVQNRQQLQAAVAHLQSKGIDAIFRFGISQDYDHAGRFVAAVGAVSLGLPGRDAYFKTDAASVALRRAYVAHAAAILQMAGSRRPTTDGMTVLRIETRLALASEDSDFHPWARALPRLLLQGYMPHFSWKSYLQSLQHPEIQQVALQREAYFWKVDRLWQTELLQDWKVYLRWRLLQSTACYLSHRFADERFRFLARIYGVQQPPPRWRMVVSAEEDALGFALGKMILPQELTPTARQQVLALTAQLRGTLARDLATASWMKPATRRSALRKLAGLMVRIGGPESWRDYSHLRIDRGPFVLNVLRASEFDFQRDLGAIARPPARGDWRSLPQTVNAFYDPTQNAIFLPAGILQPPLFDPQASLASNYGGLGTIIGHELSHAFDLEGSCFDSTGGYAFWWTPADWAGYRDRERTIVTQYSRCTAIDQRHVDGQLVAQEALADLGGVELAYQAFARRLAAGPRPPAAGGLTPEQYFFLYFAHSHASILRPESARLALQFDKHAPDRFRINVTLANVPEFRKAFGLRPLPAGASAGLCRLW